MSIQSIGATLLSYVKMIIEVSSLNQLFWLFVFAAAWYVGIYVLLIGGLYGVQAANRSLASLKTAAWITVLVFLSVVIRPTMSFIELSFLAFAYDYVTVFVPHSILAMASERISFLVLLIFFSTYVFFAIIHTFLQIFYQRRISGRVTLFNTAMLPFIVLISFTISFIACGYCYNLLI